MIPRMILVLRKLARIREAASRPAPLPRRNKVGLTIPAPAAQARTSAAAVAPDPSAKSRVVKKAAYAALEQRVAELRKRPGVPRSLIDGEALRHRLRVSLTPKALPRACGCVARK